MSNFKNTFMRPILNMIPYPMIKRIGLSKLLLLYYHIVSDEDVPHVRNLYQYKGVRQFSDDLDFLLKHYTPIDLSDVIHWVKGSRKLPPNSFLLSFDDGFREINDVIAPILLKKGIPATFFLNNAFIDNKELCFQHKASVLSGRLGNELSAVKETKIRTILAEKSIFAPDLAKALLAVNYQQREVIDPIGDLLGVDFSDYLARYKPYLTSDQVTTLLAKGFTIGAHSIDHPLYANLSLEDQLFQTTESIRQIRQQFNISYGAFAFPHNDAGVSLEFFQRMKETGLLDVSFGTGGMLDDNWASHLQRVSFEKPIIPAKEIIAWQFSRRFYKRLSGEMAVSHK